MKLYSSTIYLNNVRMYAFHGVMPQERKTGAYFLLTLRVHCDVTRAMQTDQVADTVSYAALFDLAKREMGVPSALLENVAWRIASAVFDAFSEVSAIDIRLTKENPPMGADCQGAGVELHLINDKTKREPETFSL